LSAWSLFFNKVMKDAILAEARSQAKKTQNLIDITEANLMKYIMFIIASGIASFPEESMAFRKEKNSGLTENSFLGDIFSHKDLQESKKLFIAPRGPMTTAFNQICQDLYVPEQ